MRKLIFLLAHLLIAAWSLSLLAGCGMLQQGVFPSGSKQAEADAANTLAMELAKGRNLERSNNWDKARDVYERLIEEYPQEPAPYHRLGIVADEQKRHREAQRLFSEAVRLSPTNSEVFSDLGYCFYLQGKLAKAESALRKAVRLAPEEGRYRNNLGLVLGHQRRYDEALEQFAATGSGADAYYNLAFIFASQRQDQEAQHCFELALAADPSHQKAREALDSFRRNAGAAGEELYANDGGVRYVPYQEDSPSDGSDVLQASHAAKSSPGAPSLRDARAATRELHAAARSMLDRHMASNRKDDTP